MYFIASVGCLPFRMWRSRQSGVRNGFPGTRSPGSALCASGRRPVWDFLDRTIPFGPIGGSIGTCTGLDTMHQACISSRQTRQGLRHRMHAEPGLRAPGAYALACTFFHVAKHLGGDGFFVLSSAPAQPIRVPTWEQDNFSEWVELVFEEFCRGLDTVVYRLFST